MRFIGSKLSHLRKVMDWSLQDVSDRTGLSTSHVSEIETEKRNPRPDTVRKLAEGLQIAEQYFYIEDSALPVDVIPNMPDHVKKFIANGSNIPWLVLSERAKREGLTVEDMEKIIDLLTARKKN